MWRSIIFLLSYFIMIRGSEPQIRLDQHGTLPELPEGMAWMRFPAAPEYYGDPEWYNTFGENVLQQRKIFSIESPEAQTEAINQVLIEFPTRSLEIMFQAAVKGKETIIRTLVERGIKAYPTEEDDPTLVPLHAAAYNGHLDCVKFLVEQGQVPVNSLDDLGGTPVMRASFGNHLEIVQWLLENGADPTIIQESGTGPIEFAASTGNIEATRLLLEHSEAILTSRGEERTLVTPMAIESGAYSGNIDMLKFLLEKVSFASKADGTVRRGDQLTTEERQTINKAIFRAVSSGSISVMELLISYIIPDELERQTQKYQMQDDTKEALADAMFESIPKDHVDLFGLLWETRYGAIGNEESVALVETAELLDLRDTMFATAAKEGALEIIKLLLESHHVDINFLDHRHKSTALFVASAQNHSEIVRYLVDHHNPDLHLGNGKFANGPTALFIAVLNGYPEIARSLLQHGGPVEEIDPEIKTSTPSKLILTATKEYRAKVRLMLEENATDLIAREDTSSVALEMKDEDMEWLAKVEIRKGDDKLAEGEGGRELRKPDEQSTSS